jgi:hypothetical protein
MGAGAGATRAGTARGLVPDPPLVTETWLKIVGGRFSGHDQRPLPGCGQIQKGNLPTNGAAEGVPGHWTLAPMCRRQVPPAVGGTGSADHHYSHGRSCQASCEGPPIPAPLLLDLLGLCDTRMPNRFQVLTDGGRHGFYVLKYYLKIRNGYIIASTPELSRPSDAVATPPDDLLHPDKELQVSPGTS